MPQASATTHTAQASHKTTLAALFLGALGVDPFVQIARNATKALLESVTLHYWLTKDDP
jgi:hypothetical protein